MPDPTPAETDVSPGASPSPAPGVAPAAQANPARTGRWVLAAAAVLALGAVGFAVWRGQQDPGEQAPAAAGSQEEPPSVSQVIAQLEARLAENPNDAEGWRMLGWSYFRTERFAEAATALKRASALDPDNAEIHSFLGEALVMASESSETMPNDARAAFDRALALDPKDARARYFHAAALDMEGKHREAIEAWFALLGDTPADAPWAEDVRQVIRDVGKANGIEVESRLASAKFAPPAGGRTTDGADRAAAGIPGPTRQQMQEASQLPQGQQEAMIRGMVDGLAAKLDANPNDAQGWIMLMRSRVQLGEQRKASEALQKGLAAFRNDAEASRRLREAAAALGVSGG